ncbi:MAG: hypothetical protein AB7T14_06865 [Candidatus Methylacidiphilaceae bacterium]
MKRRMILVMSLAFLAGAWFLSAAEPPSGSEAPAAPPANSPTSWQDKLADLLKRDSDLNKKIDQLDQAIRQKHDDLARSLAKELQSERSAFHRDLQQVKDGVQTGIRGAAQSLGKGASQIKEEVAKLQDALERASQQEASPKTPPPPAQP